MAGDPQPVADGNQTWMGGMDTSRDPRDIGPNQYSRAHNVIIPRSMGGVQTRPGFHHQEIEFIDKFTEDVYRNGRIQAEGFFTKGNEFFLVRSCQGYILVFSEMTGGKLFCRCANNGDRNSYTFDEAWIIRIPNGCIVNDGFNLPFLITKTGARRLDPEKMEFGVSRMGVYVQNRLFMARADGKVIVASDFKNATSVQEAYDTNIFGFAPPEDTDEITAINKQKTMLSYAEGGSLIFATRSNIYSVDVRGARTGWGLQSGLGVVQESVGGIGTISSTSFEPFNTNIYFRSPEFGLCDLRQSQYQFNKHDDFQSQSIEAAYYLDHDTNWMLHKCYIRGYGSRLLVTTAPARTEDGYTYWNGIISFHPSALYSNIGEVERRFESVWTGVRPFAMTTVSMPTGEQKLYIDSYDSDGVTRLYKVEDNSKYDVNFAFQHIDIEGFIETRAYQFEQPYKLKATDTRFYSLQGIGDQLYIKLLSRPEGNGPWSEYWNVTHKGRRTLDENVLHFVDSREQHRPFVVTANDSFADNGCSPFGLKAFAIQDRICFKGYMNLKSFVRLGKIDNYSTSVYDEEKENDDVRTYEIPKDFDYVISNRTS